MHSTTVTILGLAWASLSLAQSSTISLFIPGADTQSLVASIVGSDATATTYAFQCADPAGDCGFPEVVTLTEGPSRAAYTFAPQVDDNGTTAFNGYVDCSLASSSAVCAVSAGGTEANDPGLSTVTFTGTDYTSMPVVITAGALVASTGSSVPASTTSSSSTSKATGTNTSGSKASESGTTTSGTHTSSGAAAQTSGTSSQTGTSTSTAGGSVITGSSAWVIGGAALAFAAMV